MPSFSAKGMINFVDLLQHVAHLFEEVGARYAFVGSVASSRYGLPRATNDIDLICDLSLEQIPRFIELLGDEFYFSETSITRAVQSHRSFNLIRQELMLKVDVFIAAPNSFAAHRLTRRRLEPPVENSNEKVFMITAEDTVLAKLEWFKKGGGTSDRQWSDILGIIKVQGAALDYDYLREWAARLNVLPLLDKVIGEAKLNETA